MFSGIYLPLGSTSPTYQCRRISFLVITELGTPRHSFTVTLNNFYGPSWLYGDWCDKGLIRRPHQPSWTLSQSTALRVHSRLTAENRTVWRRKASRIHDSFWDWDFPIVFGPWETENKFWISHAEKLDCSTGMIRSMSLKNRQSSLGLQEGRHLFL